jgi:hypothetical protein
MGHVFLFFTAKSTWLNFDVILRFQDISIAMHVHHLWSVQKPRTKAECLWLEASGRINFDDTSGLESSHPQYSFLTPKSPVAAPISLDLLLLVEYEQFSPRRSFWNHYGHMGLQKSVYPRGHAYCSKYTLRCTAMPNCPCKVPDCGV